MQLNYQVFGESGPPMLIIHGLFGSIANWRTVAKHFAKQYKVFVVDQRNHGDSAQTNSMSYLDMAADINEFVCQHELRNFVLCGHSMGGKAAMMYALSSYQSAQHMRAMIVLDIAPEVYQHSHAPYLKAMNDIDLSSLASRADASQQLSAVIPENSTRLFLMQSLVRQNEQYRWKLNLPILLEYMADIVGFPHEELSSAKSSIHTLFLHGNLSDYVTEEMHDTIHGYFSNANFDSVNAGHWLHVEQRAAMISSIEGFLSQLEISTDV